MRVAGNRLKHLLDFYLNELGTLYERNEIESVFATSVNHFLGLTRVQTFSNLNQHVNQSDLLNIYDCCKALKTNKPLQYILEEAWFYNLKFYVNPSVLIPRPETEELCDLVLKEEKAAKKILDIGTGSGCIAITLKKNKPDAEVWACDVSLEALAVAKTNAVKNNTEIIFLAADVLHTKNIYENLNASFDVIISNPPYIKTEEKESLAKSVMDFEPSLALFVDSADGILFYKKIIDICHTKLNAKGSLYFELNPLTANEVNSYAEKSGIFSKTEVIKDMSGAQRFFKGIKV